MCTMLIQVICKQSPSAVLVYDLFRLPRRIKIIGVKIKETSTKRQKREADYFCQVTKKFHDLQSSQRLIQLWGTFSEFSYVG